MDAIVLSGGAAYGAYEVGVLKALSERKTGFDPEIVTGTSVGAFNAVILATESIQRLEEIWRTDIPDKGLSGNGVMRIRGNPFQYLDPTRPWKDLTELFGDVLSLTRSAFERIEAFLAARGGTSGISELIDISAFVSCEPLRQTIRKTVDFERVRASRKHIRIIATDWEAGEPRLFSKEDLAGAGGESMILASTAIPGIFPPVEVQGKVYVDGGVTMNTPLQPAIQAGATTIHVVSLDPVIRKIDPSEFDNTLEATLRVLQVAIGSAIREDIVTARSGKVTVHHYQPTTSLGSLLGILDFSRTNIEALIDRGYQDTLTHTCSECSCTASAASAR